MLLHQFIVVMVAMAKRLESRLLSLAVAVHRMLRRDVGDSDLQET